MESNNNSDSSSPFSTSTGLHHNPPGFVPTGGAPRAGHTDAELYAKILGRLDDPIAKYLCEVHNVPTHSQGSAATSTDVSKTIGIVTSDANNLPTSASTPLKFRDNWHGAISHRYAVTQKWDMDPLKDGSIYIVVQNVEECVAFLVAKMKNLDEKVEDNPGAKDRDLIANKVSDESMEVTARLILIRLLERCITGYTGLAKSEPRKEDKVNCHERFNNVAYVLERWKAVCRDVLQEDSKIVEFVHQPMTIMKQKQAHKATNNKRASTADSSLVGGAASNSTPLTQPGEQSRAAGYRRGRRPVPAQTSPTRGQHDLSGFQLDGSPHDRGSTPASKEQIFSPGNGKVPSTSGWGDYANLQGGGTNLRPVNLLRGIGGGGTASDFNINREAVESRARKSLERLDSHGLGTGNAAAPPTSNLSHLAEASKTDDQNPEGYDQSPTLSQHQQPPKEDNHPS
ncbi:hypothetical protein BDV96DRAFT_627486 [Lophiotrema nucula]|uniref:Uncharacterized protein n=1 Tax=Lophiotrema nucula TaxID=690887 RepID=A0A6A5ZQD9_9PLEO|nr:hypothetical protein BDV96DRAFT_627486 [Lophiotrema nucula]